MMKRLVLISVKLYPTTGTGVIFYSVSSSIVVCNQIQKYKS